MKNPLLKLSVCASLLLIFTLPRPSDVFAQTDFEKISISPIANSTINSLYVNPPQGDATLGGVPFLIPAGLNMAQSTWGSISHFDLNVNVTNHLRAHLLINSYNTWHFFQNQKLGEVIFRFSDSSLYKIDLIVGKNIREWRQGNDIIPTVNSVTDANSREVFRGQPTHLAGPAVLDMLKINFPSNFQGKILDKIIVADLTEGDPGVLWMGVTIEKSPVLPFLDLPWDYQGNGLSFNEAALAINSYFDHEYPLLSGGVSEPISARGLVTNFNGERRDDIDYSTHDGYDYGKQARANINDPVLAAAAGCASYTSSAAGGNIIKIDHDNGYQTRYLHLSSSGLITTSDQCLPVTTGQQIGKVGATGNVIPPGELGAHIHFMVIEDKNRDGDFDDNIPDGVTDPFGWQSTQADPWPLFAFNHEGQDRTGNASYYLWTKAINNLSETLTANGGFFALERYGLNFPQGATGQDLTLEIQSEPIQKPSKFLESIGSTIKVTATDILGNLVGTFQDFFTITINFDGFDISGYDPNSLAIYSSEDGVNWTREETEIDFIEKTASAQVNHLSFFALMAEPIDTIAPTTTAVLSGIEGEPGYFRSDVQVTLDAEDNERGLGVDYTLYKVNEEGWQEYSQPFDLIFNTQYNIQFYSVDKFGNIEDIKSITLTVDKSAPDIAINFDPDTEEFVYTALDLNNPQILTIEDLGQKRQKITAQDSAGNTTELIVKDKEKGGNAKIDLESFSFNQGPTVDLSQNKLVADVKRGKDNAIGSMSQKWMQNEVVKVRIEYSGEMDKSEIFVKFQGQEKLSDVVDGLVKLGVRTIFGTINYTLM